MPIKQPALNQHDKQVHKTKQQSSKCPSYIPLRGDKISLRGIKRIYQNTCDRASLFVCVFVFVCVCLCVCVCVCVCAKGRGWQVGERVRQCLRVDVLMSSGY